MHWNWAEVTPHGWVNDLHNEDGLLTPEQAREKATDLIEAANECDRRRGVHLESADCWCGPTVEVVAPLVAKNT